MGDKALLSDAYWPGVYHVTDAGSGLGGVTNMSATVLSPRRKNF